MGFWHTGYIEFHEPSGLDVGYRPSKVWYPCRHCTSKFDTIEDLRRHRFEAHPLARPMLFVQGQRVVRDRRQRHVTAEVSGDEG